MSQESKTDDQTWDLTKSVLMCSNKDVASQLEGCRQIRLFLSEFDDPPTEDVVKSGVIPRLIEFLKQSESPELKFEAIWALTNIGVIEEGATAIAEQGGIKPMIKLLEHKEVSVVGQAVWALGNLTNESIKLRDVVLEHDVIQCLESIVLKCMAVVHNKQQTNLKQHLECLQQIAWLLSGLCGMHAMPPVNVQFHKRIIIVLGTLINLVDTTIQNCCMFGFYYLCIWNLARNGYIVELMQEIGVLKILIERINIKCNSMIIKLLRVIVTGNTKLCRVCAGLRIMDKLTPLINFHNYTADAKTKKLSHQDRIKLRKSCEIIMFVVEVVPQLSDEILQNLVILMCLMINADISVTAIKTLTHVMTKQAQGSITQLLNFGILDGIYVSFKFVGENAEIHLAILQAMNQLLTWCSNVDNAVKSDLKMVPYANILMCIIKVCCFVVLLVLPGQCCFVVLLFCCFVVGA